MARKMGSVRKVERRFGLAPAKKGDKSFLKKKTEYGARLEEKQKLKFLYGVMEKQFAKYVKIALKSKENPGEILLQQLERRFDVVVFRLGYAKTLRQARQFVTHGFFKINGKKVNIPSYQFAGGEKIEISEKLSKNSMVQEAMKNTEVQSWLERGEKEAHFIRIPSKDEIPIAVDVKKALELYV